MCKKYYFGDYIGKKKKKSRSQVFNFFLVSGKNPTPSFGSIPGICSHSDIFGPTLETILRPRGIIYISISIYTYIHIGPQSRGAPPRSAAHTQPWDVYVYACVHIYICMYISISIYTYIHISPRSRGAPPLSAAHIQPWDVYVYACVCVYICIYISISIYTYIHIGPRSRGAPPRSAAHTQPWDVYVYDCVYIYMHVYIYIYTSMYTYIHIVKTHLSPEPGSSSAERSSYTTMPNEKMSAAVDLRVAGGEGGEVFMYYLDYIAL